LRDFSVWPISWAPNAGDCVLLKRAPDVSDRRRNVVTITPKGRRMLIKLEARIDGAQAQLLSALSPEERDHLVALLTRVVS
jgi:MarR family transcriptional regulator, lower aerobic nicotinate degradation pathway regulator